MEASIVIAENTRFPVEALEHILNIIPTRILLNSCRFVDRFWNETASRICRHRLTEPKILDSEFDRFEEIFCNSTNPPFSSFTFKCTLFRKKWPPCINPKILHFVHNFGLLNFVQKLTLVRTDIKDLLDCLQWTGTLKHLSYLSYYPYENDYQLMSKYDMRNISQNLRFLERLKFEVKDLLSSELFQIFATSNRHIRQISLQLGPNAQKFWTTISACLVKVPSISLQIYRNEVPEEYKPFQSLEIQELSIRIPDPPNDQIYFFQPLEKFLQGISCSLKQIQIYHSPDYLNNSNKPRLLFPQFHSLRSLTVFENFTEHIQRWRPRPLNIGNLFTAEVFNNLKTFSITTGGGFFNLGNMPFASVRELSVNFHHQNGTFIDHDWNRVFPNVRKLSTSANAKSCIYIMCKMKNLEELELVMNLNQYPLHQQTDINKILSGRDDPEHTGK